MHYTHAMLCTWSADYEFLIVLDFSGSSPKLCWKKVIIRMRVLVFSAFLHFQRQKCIVVDPFFFLFMKWKCWVFFPKQSVKKNASDIQTYTHRNAHMRVNGSVCFISLLSLQYNWVGFRFVIGSCHLRSQCHYTGHMSNEIYETKFEDISNSYKEHHCLFTVQPWVINNITAINVIVMEVKSLRAHGFAWKIVLENMT